MSHGTAPRFSRFGLLCGATVLTLTACSGDDENVSADVSGQLASATSQVSSMMATATGDDTLHCPLEVGGKDVQALAEKTSCAEVTDIWAQFPQRSDQACSSQVSHNGRTYRCSIAEAGEARTGACLDDHKDGFTFTG